MPLMEHLRELRNRVFKALLGMAVGVAVGFLVFEPVWEFLQRPYCALPQSAQMDSEGCQLIFTGVFDAFFLQLKVAVMVGILVSAPVWIYQLWAFVTPALRGREKLYTVYFMLPAVLLFAVGAALAYYISSLALEVMFSFAPEGAEALITISNYLNYMLTMILAFGLSFVLPLLVVALNLMGVLRHATIAKWRRVVVFVAFVLAAVVTPAEPVSMLVLGGSMVLLFEVAELIAFLNDRRRRVADPLSELDDDEISPLDEDGDVAAVSDSVPPNGPPR
ncbi:twin-arginine translocase subunit TatC [Spiractinospora alimapuensis]|uniref:twin-arginine translocase subunit TatC n=1 Tax=Spiractinospora alimapuensis TaxID=2820884 RepID=UPI001EEAAED7|nr:twin-arginine translocase subunit TatC [Spiractinospora alimapuensis]QVQ54596.1 twin-arginine translocase subunit TatC [Spiractinospora alimapuensis]